MCSSANCNPDLPPWLLIGVNGVWKHRESIGRFVVPCAVGVVVVAVLLFKFSPSDLERAEADQKKAWVVINSLEAEAVKQLDNANGHRKCAAEFRQDLEKCKGRKDEAWNEWCEGLAHGHEQLDKAKRARRDNLLRLTAQYLRLLAEAECEILRAKDARDRGTPYVVAPRVQELLAPVLAAR